MEHQKLMAELLQADKQSTTDAATSCRGECSTKHRMRADNMGIWSLSDFDDMAE